MASYILGPVWGFKRNPRYSLFPEVLHTNRFVKYSVRLSYDFIGTLHTLRSLVNIQRTSF